MKYLYISFFSFFLFAIQLNAQCKLENDYFQNGEELRYDLYFKYGLINSKAGTASLTVSDHKYKGKDAYKMQMTAKSSGFVSKLFSLNDTISGYMTKDLVPLAYSKDAHERSDYTRERIEYSYLGGGKVKMNTKRDKNGEFRFDETIEANNCVYDLVSVLYYSRTLDYENMKKGDYRTVEFISGQRKVFMHIEHQGVETVSTNNKEKHECIKLVLSLTNANDTHFNDKEEAMKVFVSNDKNRIVVRMEFKLKHGTTRGVLRSYKGLKHKLN